MRKKICARFGPFEELPKKQTVPLAAANRLQPSDATY